MAIAKYSINLNNTALIEFNRIQGECYAYMYSPLREQAQSEGISSHDLFLKRLLIGLWEAHPKFNIFVFYEALNEINRIFICSLRKLSNSFFECVHDRLNNINGYIECGLDSTDIERMRPLVYWEPPSTMIALWPAGIDGAIEGNRIIDSGSLMGYCSVEDEKLFKRIKSGQFKNPEYLCVPSDTDSQIIYNGKTYRYLNQFCSLRI